MNPKKRLRLAEEKFQAGKKAFDANQYQLAADCFLESADLSKGLKRQGEGYAICLTCAAKALRILSRYDEAKNLLGKALILQNKILGFEHPDVANSLNDLAMIHNAQADYEKAKALHEKALTIREKILSSEHPDVADSLNNLADIYKAQGNYEKAKELLEKALTISEKILGSEHSDVADNLSNLAVIYQAQGDYEKAEELLEKALTITEKTLGSEHPDMATSLNNLAIVYQEQGDYEKAKALHEKALTNREKILGSEHPDVASSLNNLAVIYKKQGDYEKAQNYYQRAQKIINQVFNENHPIAQIISRNYLELQQEVEQLRRRDVEQRVALEEAKKLSYLSYMATGVAHNINNPVGIIQLAAQRGLRKLKQGIHPEEGQEIFQRILTQADRLHNIIQQFRAFANGDRNQREPVALNTLVEQIKDYFENQLESHRITLKLELSEQNPQSQTNRFVLQEILMNLISNARDALEKTSDAFILIKTWQNTEKVGLQVEDNGVGIPPEFQKNLFSPFHSTKPHGTGLGLHFAHKAVADLGGTIEYQNRQPTGTCFIIELPPANGITI